MLEVMLPARNKVLAAALLLPVVLVSVLSTSFALWRCRADGVARASCCCPVKAAAADTGQRTLTISRARCCDLERHQVERAPAELGRARTVDFSELMAASVAAVPVTLLPLFEAQEPRTWTARPAVGLPSGRSRLVQKQAFLI